MIAWKKANVWKKRLFWNYLYGRTKFSKWKGLKNSRINIHCRLKAFFESENVVNLYNGKLSSAEISLLSKGLKFCPTPNSVDKCDVKEDLEKSGRFLRLKWRYGNDKQTFDPNSFRPKSKFNPSNSDAAIELYLSQTKEKLLSCTQIKLTYYKLIREEQQSLSYLKNGWSIVIKKADNGSAMVTWG